MVFLMNYKDTLKISTPSIGETSDFLKNGAVSKFDGVPIGFSSLPAFGGVRNLSTYFSLSGVYTLNPIKHSRDSLLIREKFPSQTFRQAYLVLPSNLIDLGKLVSQNEFDLFFPYSPLLGVKNSLDGYRAKVFKKKSKWLKKDELLFVPNKEDIDKIDELLQKGLEKYLERWSSPNQLEPGVTSI